MIARARRCSKLLLLPLLLLLLVGVHSAAAASGPRQDSYPPPTTEFPTPGAGQPTPTLAAYPPVEPDFLVVTPAPIGIQGAGQPQDNLGSDAGLAAQPAAQAGSRGLVFLWLGFMATLLIFLISVVGSILLFTRRNED